MMFYLLEPKFENVRGTFKVTLYNERKSENRLSDDIIEFCRKPRAKEVIAKQFGFDEKHPAYFVKNYICNIYKMAYYAIYLTIYSLFLCIKKAKNKSSLSSCIKVSVKNLQQIT